MQKYLFSLLVLFLLVGCAGESSKKDNNSLSEVNVYSHRHYEIDQKVFDRFTEETGIQVNVVKAAADELINRLQTEGENSPADVLITVDAMKLNRAKELNLLQTVEANTNNAPTFIEEEGYWYGITYRARVIVYDKEKVKESDLSTYEDLASDKWNDRILIRSSSSTYNQSLLASIIEATDEATATKWASAVVENLAREPKGGDRDQIKAIASGVGDLAVVNTYYLGLMLNSPNQEEVNAANKVGIYFPNQDGRGAHINISGIGVTKNAPNKDHAIKLIEFLTSDEIQTMYTNNSYEFPVSQNVSPAETVANWGEFKIDNLDYAKKTNLNDQAVSIFEQVGWK